MFKLFSRVKELEKEMTNVYPVIERLNRYDNYRQNEIRDLCDKFNRCCQTIDSQNKEIDKLKRIIKYGDRDYPRYHFEAPVVANCKYPLRDFMTEPLCIVYIYDSMEEYPIELKEIFGLKVFEDTVELTFDGDLAELTLETRVDDDKNLYHRFIINYKTGSYVHTEVEIPAGDDGVKEPVCP